MVLERFYGGPFELALERYDLERMSARVPILPFTAEGLVGRPLSSPASPARILLVRLQAFGDCVATLPVVGALRDRFPKARLDVVTGPGTATLYEARSDVDRVFVFDGGAPRVRRLLAAVAVTRSLGDPRVDVVLDLQRSRWSRLLTRLVRPRAWAAFDRFAPKTGLERYLEAAAWAGLGALEPVFEPRLAPTVLERARVLLSGAGRDPARPLVCLNPAGGWITKQWPLDRYAELGRRFAMDGAELVLLGDGAAASRVRELRDTLGVPALDLVGRTSPDIAMAVVALCALVVSDDSGLLHLAWTQGVPALALFGASRSAWSRPMGSSSAGFYSEDLACGACMQPECARKDVHCLMRVGVEDVHQRARALIYGGGTS